MEDKRELAVGLAVNYCQTHQTEDLIAVAEKIYQFLIKTDEK